MVVPLLAGIFTVLAIAGLQYASSLLVPIAVAVLLTLLLGPLVRWMGNYGVAEPDYDALRRMLENVKPTDPSVPCERRLITGSPAQAIVELAASEGVDMIVMGTHGRTGLARLAPRGD